MQGKIAVIGGGPAGMMAAIRAAETLGDGSCITLFERNDRLGRKIYLTGKGRCNLTNRRGWEEFSPHIHPNQGFLKHAFRAFSNEELIRYFEEVLGVPTVTQQGQRVFPASLVAGDVARALERRVHALGVEVRYGSRITSLEQLDGYSAVIVATGGKSYPVTGSTGDGYTLAREAGHAVTALFPSETAMLPKDYDRSLIGLTLKHVSLSLNIDKTCVQQEEGEFDFTPDGMESGIAYKLSRRAVWALVNGQKVEIVLDLKPALSEEQLNNRLMSASRLRDCDASQKNALLTQVPPAATLRSFMPQVLIEPFVQAHPGISNETLPKALKYWSFPLAGYKGFERAVVTAGGVSLKEIVPKTMESRLRRGLYFCGEVLDLDGDTGGYNLQTAFSTGALAGVNAARSVLQ